MKKWMRAMSLMFALLMTLCVVGGVKAKASSYNDEIYRITVRYTGDPVRYGDTINPADFEVRAYYRNSNRSEILSSSEYSISPSTMESKSSQRVYVSVNGIRDVSVSVKCAEPELTSIEAWYEGGDLVVGGEIDKKDVTVRAYYDYQSSDWEYVTDWEFGSYRLREGSNEIPIYYRENGVREYTTITVYAYEGKLSYITAYYSGGNVTVGNKVNTANIRVTGLYTGRGYGNVTQTLTGWSLSDYTIHEGTNTLTVVYRENGEQFTDTITVRGVAAASTTTPTVNPNTVGSISSSSGTWVLSGPVWKFQLANGTYVTNSWVRSAETGYWYYVNSDGNMETKGWISVGGKWYYVLTNGMMVTGWRQDGGKWYYLREGDGDMITGWKQIKGVWYYLTPGSGEMATSRWIDNYYVDESGAWREDMVR